MYHTALQSACAHAHALHAYRGRPRCKGYRSSIAWGMLPACRRRTAGAAGEGVLAVGQLAPHCFSSIWGERSRSNGHNGEAQYSKRTSDQGFLQKSVCDPEKASRADNKGGGERVTACVQPLWPRGCRDERWFPGVGRCGGAPRKRGLTGRGRGACVRACVRGHVWGLLAKHARVPGRAAPYPNIPPRGPSLGGRWALALPPRGLRGAWGAGPGFVQQSSFGNEGAVPSLRHPRLPPSPGRACHQRSRWHVLSASTPQNTHAPRPMPHAPSPRPPRRPLLSDTAGGGGGWVNWPCRDFG